MKKGFKIFMYSLILTCMFFVASCERKIYTITFEENGGSEVTDVQIPVNEVPELPNALTKEGHTFSGWFLDETLKFKYSPTKVEGNMTLYAKWTVNKYTISYETNGGGEISTHSINYGSEIELAANPTKVGHEFVGWYTDAALTNKFEETTMPAENIKLYAAWDAYDYVIKFVSNDDEIEDYRQTVEYGQKVTRPADPTREGYTFKGWQVKEEAYDFDTVVKADVTLIASWEINSYTISFDSNGGSEVADSSYNYGALLSEPARPTKLGYTFNCWTLNDQPYTFVGKTMPAANLNLKASWLAGNYTVYFNANASNATGTVASIGAYYDQEFEIPTNAYSLTGYTFAGWNAEEDGNGDSYTVGSKVSNLTSEKDGVVVIYAQWTPNTYTVKFDANGGTGTMANLTMTYDKESGLTANAFTKVGYAFEGWALTSDGSVRYANLDTVSNLAASGEVTLYAKWTANGYTVAYNANGGNGTMSNDSRLVDDNKSIKANTFTRKGYTFVGWNTLANGEGQNVAIDSKANLTTTANETVTLYAKWTANSYTVKFDANGGEGTMADQNRKYDDGLTISANTFTKVGYTFAGWLDGTKEIEDLDGTNLADAEGAVVTLKAQWAPISYTISFDLNGGNGSIANIENVTYDVEKQLPASIPTKDGFTFAGWLFDFQTYQASAMVNNLVSSQGAEAKLVAQWTRNSYKLTIVYNNGENNKEVNYLYEAEIEAVAIPTKEGTAFKEWTLADGSKFVFEDAKMPSHDLTIYASYFDEVKLYFNFNYQGAEIPEEFKPVDGYQGKVMEAPESDPTRRGYTFAGWYQEASCENEFEFTVFGNTDVTVYAKWTPITYTIKFDLNDGEGDFANITDVVYDQEKQLPTSVPTKVGYAFAGWLFENDNYEAGSNVLGLVDTQGAQAILVAQWTANSYTVAYDANGGTNTMASESRFVDDKKTIKTNTFVRDGYTFAGWNTLANGEGQVIAIDFNGNLTTTAGATVTLYAQWTANTYTIKFDGNGNTNEVTMADQVRKYNDNEFVSYNLFVKKGYTFAGWLLNDKEVSASSKENLTELVGLENTNNAEITLKARWVANSYTVIFNANGGNGNMANQTFTYDDAKGLNPNLFTKVGYSFVGWADGQVAYTDEQEVINLVSSGSITLYAKWEADTYTVLFQHGKDDVTNTRTVKYDDLLDLTNTFDNPFEYTGHTFDGWLLNEGDRNATFTTDVEQVVFSKAVIRTINTEAKRLTLTAKWLANDVVVNFYDAADSSTVASVTVKYGDTYSKLEEAVKDNWVKYGYKYIGAYSSSQCLDSELITFTGNQDKIYDSLDIYFKWESTKYTVKFIVDGQAIFTIPEQEYMAEGIGEKFNEYIDNIKYELDLVSRYHMLVLALSSDAATFTPFFQKITSGQETSIPGLADYEAGYILKLFTAYPNMQALTEALGYSIAVGEDPTNAMKNLYGYVNTVRLSLDERSTMFATKQNGYYIPSKEGYMCEGWVLGDATAYDDEHQKGSPFTGHVPASTEAFEDGADVRIVAKWTGVDAINLTKDNFEDDGEIKKLTWQAVTIDSTKYKSYSVVYVITHETLDGTRKELVEIASNATGTIEYVFNTTDPSNEEKPYFAPGTYRIRVTARVMVETLEGEKYNLISEDAKAPLDVTFALNGLVDEELIAGEVIGSYYYKLDIEDPNNPNALDVFYFYTGYNYNFAATNSFQLLDGEHGEPIDENDYVAITGSTISTKDVFGTFHFTNTKDGVTTEFLAYVLPVVSQFNFGEDIAQFNSLNNKEVESLYQSSEKQDYVIGVSTNTNKHADYIIYEKGGELYTSEEINRMIASGQTINLAEYTVKYDNGFKFDVALKTANGETINTADYQKDHLEYKFYDVETGLDITDQFGYENNDVWYIDASLLRKEILSSNGSDYYLSEALEDNEANKDKLAAIANRKYRVEINIYKYYVPNALENIVKPISFEFKLNNSINVFSHEALKTSFADTGLSNGVNIHSNITPVLSADQLYHDGDGWYAVDRSKVNGTPINRYYDEVMNRQNVPNGNVYQRASGNSDLNGEKYQINGNFFTIDGSKLPYTNIYSIGNLSSVPGYEICNVQMSMFAYLVSEKWNELPLPKSNASLNVSNLRVIGNSMNASLEMDGITLMNKNSGGYIGIRSTFGATMNIENTIVQNTNIGVFVTEGSSAYLNYLTTSSCWSNSIYGPNSRTVALRNSYLKDSGGAAIHLEDGLSSTNETYRLSNKNDITIGEKKYNVYSELYFDETTRFENYVSGEEGYFKANSIELLVMKLKTEFDNNLKGANYTVIDQKIKHEQGTEKINFILLMPPANRNKEGTSMEPAWNTSVLTNVNGAKRNYITLNIGYHSWYCQNMHASTEYDLVDGMCPVCATPVQNMTAGAPAPFELSGHYDVIGGKMMNPADTFNGLVLSKQDGSEAYSVVPYGIPGFGDSVIVIGAKAGLNG